MVRIFAILVVKTFFSLFHWHKVYGEENLHEEPPSLLLIIALIMILH